MTRFLKLLFALAVSGLMVLSAGCGSGSNKVNNRRPPTQSGRGVEISVTLFGPLHRIGEGFVEASIFDEPHPFPGTRVTVFKRLSPYDEPEVKATWIVQDTAPVRVELPPGPYKVALQVPDAPEGFQDYMVNSSWQQEMYVFAEGYTAFNYRCASGAPADSEPSWEWDVIPLLTGSIYGVPATPQ